jgi:hypothetical protein
MVTVFSGEVPKRKGKVWQQKSGTVSQWVDWCNRTWEKVSSKDAVAPNITRDFLRPIRLTVPHDSYPVVIQWGEHIQMSQNERQSIKFGDTTVPLFLIDLDIANVADDRSPIIRISNEENATEYRLTISSEYPDGYHYEKLSGQDLMFNKANGDLVPFPEFLKVDPFIVRYADGTHSYNCYHIPVHLDAGTFPISRLEIWDWDGIPLNRESMGKMRAKNTIQYRSFETISDEFDLIFNDDGKGEAADLVLLSNVDEATIRLSLLHCKNAYDGIVSADIRNFYTLCGQAQKSASVKHRGMPKLFQDLKRRHETWANDGHSRFLKGNMKDLAYFKEKARRSKLEFEVIIVQPGASVQNMTDNIKSLLATTELYLKKTCAAEFRVVVSK